MYLCFESCQGENLLASVYIILRFQDDVVSGHLSSRQFEYFRSAFEIFLLALLFRKFTTILIEILIRSC